MTLSIKDPEADRLARALVQARPANMAGLFLLILFVWVSCLAFGILMDPNFPDDVSVSLDQK
jgi:hypothetical protein